MFGNEWIKKSIVELFQEDIARHKVIFTAPVKEDSLRVLQNGGIPKLKSLMLFYILLTQDIGIGYMKMHKK